jgi:hypothetical protein
MLAFSEPLHRLAVAATPRVLVAEKDVEAAVRTFLGPSASAQQATQIARSLDSRQRGLLSTRVGPAWDLLSSVTPQLPLGPTGHLEAVFFATGDLHTGGSSSALSGVAWLLPAFAKSPLELAEALLHEAVHAHLFALEARKGRLVRAPTHGPVVDWSCLTPLHAKVRGLEKVLHAAVIARAVLAFRERFKEAQNGTLSHPADVVLRTRMRASREAFDAQPWLGLALSPLGYELLSGALREV